MKNNDDMKTHDTEEKLKKNQYYMIVKHIIINILLKKVQKYKTVHV